VVTSLSYILPLELYIKSSKNFGKLTCVYGRFKSPFFYSMANIDFEGGDNDHGYGDCMFGSFMRNPVIQYPPPPSPVLPFLSSSFLPSVAVAVMAAAVEAGAVAVMW
jgi:hypothetical protein